MSQPSATKKKVDVSKLMKKVDGLLDETPPQVDEAIPLLRQVVEAEPDRLMALHSLNWAMDALRRVEPDRWTRELKAEHWRVRDRVLALTRGTRSGGKLSDAQRARSLALSQWAEEVVRGRPTDAQLDEVEAALEEAQGLRDIPDHARARRGLEAWRALRPMRSGPTWPRRSSTPEPTPMPARVGRRCTSRCASRTEGRSSRSCSRRGRTRRGPAPRTGDRETSLQDVNVPSWKVS
jgi:hypothetical protein